MKKQLFLLIFFQLTTYVLVWGQLSAPTNLSASASSSSQINLTWSDNATFESGYQVERSNDGSNFSKIADLGANTTNYANTDLAASTKYYYRVRAVSAAGASGYSRTVEATTQAPPINFPNSPSNLSAVAASNSQINLTWSDNATNETGYVVERSTDGVIFFKIADLGANSTSFENTGLMSSTKYWYRVQAVSAAANSGFSNVAEATTQAPPINFPNSPSNLSAVAISSSQINLTWSDNATNETGYVVERSTDGVIFFKIADLGANSTNFENTGLTASTKYWYRVQAVSAAANSGFSNFAEATTQAPPINFPNSPSNLSAVAASNSQINLTWSDNATNETGYVVERSTDGVIFFKIADLGANSTSFENAGLAASTKYWYRAQAVSAAANSGFSNVAEATTQAPPIVVPQAPTNLFIVSISSVEVVLQWTDNAKNESGYQVERSVNGTDFVKIADLGANVTTYSNGNLTPQKSYWYRVQAVSVAANSPYSNVVNTTTPPVPPKLPETPQNLRVQPLDFELVRLNWNPLSALAKTIIIERSKNANTGFVQIAQISAQTVEFFDKEILDLTDYYYRIKATNAEGSSSYSNLAMLSAGAIITSIQSNVPDPIAIFSVEHTLHIKNAENSRAQIFDLRGISHADFQIPTTQWQSNMTYLSSGLYIVRLQKDNQVITQKILIP